MFNSELAYRMLGARTEQELREKIYGTWGALIDEELELIFESLDNFDSPTYAEIGVWFGGTFAKVLNFLKEKKTNTHAYGLDLFEDLKNETFGPTQTHELANKWNILNVAHQEDLQRRLCDLGHGDDKFTLLKGSSEKTALMIDGIIDVCLIDGNHTYEQAMADYQSIITKCKSGSCIIFDNSSNDIEPDPRYVAVDGGPWRVCEEIKSDDRIEFAKRVNRCSLFRVK